MSSFGYWTVATILYQTIFSIAISWLILDCQLPPDEAELHEITLIKLLYLHDPEACERVYFYNYTRSQPTETSNIIWPVKNDVATQFRKKIRTWLCLHIAWAAFGVVYLTQGQRSCGYYAALLPFTLAGLAVLAADLAFATMFLMDVSRTATEASILEYINADAESVRMVNKTQMQSIHAASDSEPVLEDDTSWIALLLAYISCRALVQWFLNFWTIKDNYYDGVAYYRKLSKTRELQKRQMSKRFSSMW